jgi:DNA repair protein RadA/Sms
VELNIPNGRDNAMPVKNGTLLLRRSFKNRSKKTGNLRQQERLKERQNPLRIAEIEVGSQPRLNTNNSELNRVLGGGLVPGSLTLLGGEPGIGKSTLLLQISLHLNQKTLYVSGEESQQQIKMRAERINPNPANCYILTETKTQNIFRQIEELDPEIVIIDSIQTLHSDYIESSPGSISQIRECTAELIKYAKETGVPVILIGHISPRREVLPGQRCWNIW